MVSMEEQTLWSPSPSVVILSDSEEDMEDYVEEIIIEEDGNPVEQKWNVDEVLTLSPSGFVKSLDDSSSSDLIDPLAASPQYILPDELTFEESTLLEESFTLMEDLLSKKDEGLEWKVSDKETAAEKAQELLDDLNKDSWLIKEEPFSDWLEEKTELQLLEELGGSMNSYQRSTLPATIAAVPYEPRHHQIQVPHVGQIAPQLASSSGLTLLSSSGHIELANISAHVPNISVEVPSAGHIAVSQQPPLTPALIREFETVLHQTLTPPHTPPTYIDLVNQEEESKRREIAEEELDALINSQVASFYEEKKEKEWSLSTTQDSPTSDWGSASTSATTEDSDSVCLSSSESDPDWAPSESGRSGTSRNRRAVSSTEERKMRKKEQNKNAATRYRMKKKAEQAGIVGEESVLLEHNTSLKEKETELQREIKYLKSLMKDFCKAKGLIQ